VISFDCGGGVRTGTIGRGRGRTAVGWTVTPHCTQAPLNAA
jgi:hypothetical protein